jgi:hypothetical protein
MKEISLQNSLGHPKANAVMQDVIFLYENAFPEQIVAYYVEGSYVDQSYFATSDLDVVIVLRNPIIHEDIREQARSFWKNDSASPMEVDIIVTDEESLQKGVNPNLKLGGRFMYGQDVCQDYPILPIEMWTRDRMHAAYWLIVKIYQRPIPVHFPLDFPSPSDEFYGYTNRTVQLPDGREVPCTRNLVRTTGWAATALLALQAGCYAGRKRDCARLYREHIGGEWGPLLTEIADVCRDEWQYLIPGEPHARQRLGTICEQALHFEQHFLAIYKSYLLEQLRSTKQAKTHALWVQNQVPFDDEEISMVIQTIQL